MEECSRSAGKTGTKQTLCWMEKLLLKITYNTHTHTTYNYHPHTHKEVSLSCGSETVRGSEQTEGIMKTWDID